MTVNGRGILLRGHRAHGHNLTLKGQAMTGEKNTNRAGARKVSRAHSQPTSPAASTKKSAATPKTSGQPVRDIPAPTHAAEGSASSPEGASPFSLELPVIIDYPTGLDPAALPRHRVLASVAVRGMDICESLFWVVQQLGNMAESDG